MAKLLEPDFRVLIHQRAAGTHDLATLASQLHTVLRNPPYLIAAHSFGGLVARQFAALYPNEVAGIVFVDALPLTAELPVAKAIAIARAAQLIAPWIPTLLPLAAKHIRLADWLLQELSKLPDQRQILAEWSKPAFYASLASLLAALPRNLRRARTLPLGVPTVSLHSDYPDPEGRRIEDAGHWIQVDQPHAVASAIRELARGA